MEAGAAPGSLPTSAGVHPAASTHEPISNSPQAGQDWTWGHIQLTGRSLGQAVCLRLGTKALAHRAANRATSSAVLRAFTRHDGPHRVAEHGEQGQSAARTGGLGASAAQSAAAVTVSWRPVLLKPRPPALVVWKPALLKPLPP